MTEVSLKYLCSLPPEYGLNITPDRYRDEGVRLLRTSDIATGGGVRDSGGVFLDAEDVPAEMLLHDGDLLFSRSGTLGRALLYGHDQHDEATFAGFLVRFRLRRGIDPRAIRYWSESASFVGTVASEAIQSTISNFNADRYANLAVPAWLVDHSTAVADYLDAETARIDALVVARRRTAELVELRLAVYARQLVSQDHEGRPYERVPLRRRWSVIDCKHRTPAYQMDGYPVVSPGDATAGRLDLSRCTRFVGQDDFDDLTEGPRRPRRGDIIYTRNASIGIAAYVDTDDLFTMGQDVCLIRSAGQDQRFLTAVLNTLGLDQLDEQKIGSTFNRINVARVLDLSVPCPPVAEQRTIADKIDDATAWASSIVSATQRHVALLLERRQALVTAAVTGQLDIPGVAA